MTEKSYRDSLPQDLLNEKQLKLNTELPGKILEKLLAIFINETPDTIKSMKESLAKSDFEKLQSDAHGLKGASMTIGAKKLPAICAELQEYSREKNSAMSQVVLKDLEDCFHATCGQISVFLEKIAVY